AHRPVPSVHRFAASSPLDGSPTLDSVGPTVQFHRYTASRPLHLWTVPPRWTASGPPSSSIGTPLRGLFTSGRFPHAEPRRAHRPVPSVHRFAVSSPLDGSPTLNSVGPTVQFRRYTA